MKTIFAIAVVLMSGKSWAEPTIAFGMIKGIKSYALDSANQYIQVHFAAGYETDIPSCNGVATLNVSSSVVNEEMRKFMTANILAAYTTEKKIKLTSASTASCEVRFVLFSPAEIY